MHPFRCELLAATEMPQRLVYLALHNDYSETFCPTTELPEDRCGQIAAKRLLEGGRGHYGPLEHPQLSLLLQIDHNTAMQLRTHRVGLTFDLQSQRYTGERILKAASGEIAVEEVFYIRPAGKYHDRQGEPYTWSDDDIHQYKTMLLHGAQYYAFLRGKGASEEHARGILPTCYFQNTAISGNLRAWLHLLDVRLKADAQDEIRWAMQLAAQQVQRWVPEIYSWYAAARKGKAQLAP